jgi:hypothetical protein
LQVVVAGTAVLTDKAEVNRKVWIDVELEAEVKMREWSLQKVDSLVLVGNDSQSNRPDLISYHDIGQLLESSGFAAPREL